MSRKRNSMASGKSAAQLAIPQRAVYPIPTHSKRAVTRGYRHAIDKCLRVTDEADAVDTFISETESCLANLLLSLGCGAALRPSVDRLRNMVRTGIDRPEFVLRRRFARATHSASVQVGDSPTVKDRADAVSLREDRGTAFGDVHRDCSSSRCTGGGRTQSKIAIARPVIVTGCGHGDPAEQRTHHNDGRQAKYYL